MRLRRSLFLLVIVGATACGPSGQPPKNATEPPAETAQPLPPATVEEPAQVPGLAGAWRVAGIDGRSFDEPYALALAGDEQQLWWEPRCAGMARTYRIEGQSVSFGSTRPPVPAGSPPPPVCDIGLPPRLADVMRALDGANSITRTAENGVLISGPDHSLTLFSQ